MDWVSVRHTRVIHSTATTQAGLQPATAPGLRLWHTAHDCWQQQQQPCPGVSPDHYCCTVDALAMVLSCDSCVHTIPQHKLLQDAATQEANTPQGRLQDQPTVALPAAAAAAA
jgi:hypothetical protein